jgi:hypothetical protein
MVVLAPWNLMKLSRFGFSLELINPNNDCVKTIFVSLYLFVRSQTSLDHLVLSSEARRYLTFDIFRTIEILSFQFINIDTVLRGSETNTRPLFCFHAITSRPGTDFEHSERTHTSQNASNTHFRHSYFSSSSIVHNQTRRPPEYWQAYRCVLALSNIGISLLERHA